MNLHTTEIRKKSNGKRTRNASRKKSGGNLIFVMKIIVLLLVIFMFAAARALINSEIEKLNRRVVKVKSQIHCFDRDIANLKIRVEQYRGRYVLNRIRSLQLKLHHPLAGQVRSLGHFYEYEKQIISSRKSNLILSQR